MLRETEAQDTIDALEIRGVAVGAAGERERERERESQRKREAKARVRTQRMIKGWGRGWGALGGGWGRKGD